MDNSEASGPSFLSTSAATVRNLSSLNFSSPSHTGTRTHEHTNDRTQSDTYSRTSSPSRQGSPFSYFSHPSSPHSSWPSPSSPSGESVSSLPSVGSSFMFSSLPASPPHHPHQEHPRSRDVSRTGHHHLGEADSSLIIPSLTLPTALRAPTAYGRTLGRVRLLVLGHSSDASTKVTNEIISLLADEEYEEVVHVGVWEDTKLGSDKGVNAKVLRISTDWVERHEGHGEGRYEPARNVEIVKMDDYGPNDVCTSLDILPMCKILLTSSQPTAELEVALSVILAPFRVHSDTRATLPHKTSSSPGSAEPGTAQTRSELSSPLILPIIKGLSRMSPPAVTTDRSSSESLYTAMVLIPATRKSRAILASGKTKSLLIYYSNSTD